MDYLVDIFAIIPLLVDGLLITLAVSLLAAAGALILSLPLLGARRSQNRWLRYAATTYIALMRGLPIVILVFLFYFGLPALLGLGRVSAFWVGVVALAMNGAAFLAEIFRGAIQRIPDGQAEAARALGLNRAQTWRLVLIPQVLPVALPAMAGEIGFLVKASPVLSLITLVDLTRRSQQVAMQTFDPLAPTLAAALVYFVVLWSIAMLSRWLERRLEPVTAGAS
ncbi:amino acid ABC transporter permease [Microbaculum marinisediminis]|uniref:Amino acid ABC transporter permease n=1 Tax=Microbaculum marinisediminis TaxID=2931392 RepID=A0AAW5R0S5_9HYPH|nr:amino acid ABC transporter permease [Microbaculum sp. A6E488]MCT8973886.1 amino acid ABC transporter permease [Microbaculum sp. A6E488]